MGNGDKKTKKGKLHNKSYGVSRPRPNKRRKNMNTLQKIYNDLDNSNFDCNSISDIQALLKEACHDITQEDASILDLEWQIFNINKSFQTKNDIEKGTVNGLSWKLAGKQTLEDGSEIPCYWPDVSKLKKEDYEYCEKRYNECKNLYAKTEYGLMVYFGQQTDFSKRIDFKNQLCNELFTLAKEYFQKHSTDGGCNYYSIYFDIALKLAFAIAENAKLTNTIDCFVKYIFDTQQDLEISKETIKIIMDLTYLMSDNFRVLNNKIEFNKVVGKLVEVVKYLEETDLFGAEHAINKVLKIQQQLGLPQECSLRNKAEIYEKLMKDGEENRQNNLVALKFAEDALRIYKSLNDQSKIDELNEKYKDLRGKIQLSKHYFEFPKEHTQKITEQINTTVLNANENEIIYHFIITPWYSKIADIQQTSEKLSTVAVLSSMLPTAILDKFGNTVETFRTEEEIKKHNFWQSYTFNNQVGTQTMHQFYIEAYKAGKLSYNSVIDYLETTWLSEPIVRNYHSSIVEIKPIDTIKPSLSRIFSELDLCFQDENYKFDYVTVTDSLTLKIEQILRNFCEKLGIPTFKLRKDNIVMEKLLDEILSDIKHSSENSTGFDEEDRMFIKYVMCEKGGLNLRNKVAHGLMDLNEYVFSNILLLFCIVMKLSKYIFTPID
ncbi:hypothetical protein FACS189423_05350 [Bacteroidia bacterium]|nr:hypothetical protein FACS189423_05350 [Bacteroidia bacterium]